MYGVPNLRINAFKRYWHGPRFLQIIDPSFSIHNPVVP